MIWRCIICGREGPGGPDLVGPTRFELRGHFDASGNVDGNFILAWAKSHHSGRGRWVRCGAECVCCPGRCYIDLRRRETALDLLGREVLSEREHAVLEFLAKRGAVCWPKLPFIAKQLGPRYSAAQVEHALRELRRKSLVDWVYVKPGQRLPNGEVTRKGQRIFKLRTRARP